MSNIMDAIILLCPECGAKMYTPIGLPIEYSYCIIDGYFPEYFMRSISTDIIRQKSPYEEPCSIFNNKKSCSVPDLIKSTLCKKRMTFKRRK